MWAQNLPLTMDVHSVYTQPLLGPHLPTPETNTESLIWHHPQQNQPDTGVVDALY